MIRSNLTKGIVFDIQRFSVNDGPGIRTTVFLKGCALECSWCHNPESWNPDPEIGFIEDKCTLCKMCADVCEFNVHSFTEEEHSIARTKCSLCGQCVEVCSNNALKIYGKEYSVDEILDIVLKDKVYYIESNGGVTLSGGEPLQQFKFVMELFQKLKTESIHTCLDTTGFTNESIMEHIIPWTDLFLFDYKLSDSEQYCLHTKMNMDTILRNLKLLNFHGKRVILRCPIIPGINDNIKHVDSIIDLASYNENISQIDVIPYHRMGESKYNHVNRSRNYRAEINYAIPLERIKNRLRTHLTVPVNLSKESTRA